MTPYINEIVQHTRQSLIVISLPLKVACLALEGFLLWILFRNQEKLISYKNKGFTSKKMGLLFANNK